MNTTQKNVFKVTSTSEKCIFVPMAEKKKIDIDGNWASYSARQTYNYAQNLLSSIWCAKICQVIK